MRRASGGRRLARSLGILTTSCLAAAGLTITGTASGATTNSSSGIPAANKAVAALTKRPTSIGITVKIKKPIPKGKTIDMLVCSLPECTVLVKPAQQAAAVLGWHLQTVDEGVTPTSVSSAWKLAISQHPDAIMTGGFPTAMFASELAQAKVENIPVIDSYEPDLPGGGITAEINGPNDYATAGGALADWVLSKEGKSAHALFLTSSTFPIVTIREQQFQKRYHQLCPTCKVSVLDESATAAPTQVTSSVVAYLHANPSVNFVVLGESSQIEGLPQALTSAGLHTPVIVPYVDSSTISALTTHTQVQALVVHGTAIAEWMSIDALARYFTGQSVAPDEASPPVWILTPKTAKGLSSPYIQVVNYQEQFKALWGVK